MEKKPIIPHKAKLKTLALSVFLAVIVWFMVIYASDPDITTTVSDLDVRFVGEMSLREKNLSVTGKNNIPELSVVVTGKRSDLMNFMDDIYVQVNVEDLDAVGEYSLSGAISIPTTRITVEKEKYGDIPLTVEPLEEKEITITTKQTGTPKDKMIKSTVTDPKVTITGAKSEIDEVYGAVATIDVSEIKEDTTEKVNYLLTDSTGALIVKNETIESTRSFVEVSNTVYEAKTLPVVPMLTAELDKLYILKTDKTVVTPTNLTVGVGLSNTDERLIVHIDSVNTSDTKEYEIDLPNGMYIPDDSKTVRLKADIVKKAVAQVEFTVTAENVGSGLTATVPDKLIAQVWGEEGKISADLAKATVDVTGLGVGEYNLPVELTGDYMGFQENYTVNVKIE